VSYVIGSLSGNAHPDAAAKYLGFLQSDKGQDAYAKFGFVNASKSDLESKPIP